MRVLFWCESFWPNIGGSETFAATLIDYLRARGHEFAVMTRLDHADDPAELDYDGIPVYRIPIDERAATSMDADVIVPARQLATRLQLEFRPELVHVSLPGPSLIAAFGLFARRPGSRGISPPRLLVSAHVPIEPTVVVFERPAWRIMQMANWVTAPSRALLDHIRWMVPETRGKSSVIHNGLRPVTALPTPIPWEEPTLFVSGRLVRQKGFDTVIRALAMLTDDWPRLQLVIAGDGPLRSELEALAHELQVSARTRFLGWVQAHDLPHIINRATIVIVPSEWEPFGLVAVEAMLMGRPVIASQVDGLPEVVSHEVTGLLADPGNVADFATKIHRLLLDRNLSESMGIAGRGRAEEYFSVERMGQGFLSLYDALGQDRV